MGGATGSYTDWLSIDYCPTIQEILPTAVGEWLPCPSRVLDVGCNKGYAANYLASLGHSVTGIDINTAAIRHARSKRVSRGLDPEYLVGDILTRDDLGLFDAVLLIRVLTCFSSGTEWEKLVNRSRSLLVPNGLLYISDFIMDPDSAVYAERYRHGLYATGRQGNFLVHDEFGNLKFIAHHHTREEITRISRGYLGLKLQYHPSMSMNGNPCMMFDFIGRKGTEL